MIPKRRSYGARRRSEVCPKLSSILDTRIFLGRVPKSGSDAVLWLTKAAEQGNVDAQINLGVAYLTGEIVDKNPKLAFYWYEKAAQLNDSKAQFNVALMYLKGVGVEQNDDLAIQWLKRSAAQGYRGAEEALDRIHAALKKT
ncbi:sel1 repeat family protein [Mesorhizobium sp. M8A.F.Ca.ET.207.01.1.1]|nr:sel1 repeat family protein [Mesorhizobium sp. M8A.F.Ca.ET.207.01.1.1]